MAHSTFTGPGELLLAPNMLGDITNIRLTGDESWTVGKDSFMACTQGVVKDYKTQSFSKAMFSGEGFFVFKMSGVGICWIMSMGAIIRKDVSQTLEMVQKCIRIVAYPFAAPREREVHHRQRPSCGMELQVHNGAHRKRWYHQQYKRRRRLGVQVHWSWYRFHADQKSDRCGGVLQRSNSGLENDLRATCTYRRWSGRILRLISIYFHGATLPNVTLAVHNGVGNASSHLHSIRNLTTGQYTNIAVFPFNPMLANTPDSIQEPHLLIHNAF